MKLPVLPVYYYHDHFTEMLDIVSDTYGAVLTDRHRAFIATFATISKDAQCLLIRMINRRGSIFRQSAFRYAEISNPCRAVAELRALGYVRSLADSDYASFIVCHAKEALTKAGKDAGLTDLRTSWAKGKVVDYYLANVSFETAYHHCGGDDFIALGDTAPVEFLLYLYFGKTERDLKNFALRDLGILRTNKNANLSARFTDAEEAHASFHYSRLLDRLEIKSEVTFRASISEILDGPECTTDYAEELKSRAAHRAGQFFEKDGEKGIAIQLYRAGSSFLCNERLTRLLYSTGDKKGSEELLRRMIDDPASDDEFVFANDFYARKFNGRRTGLCIELLRAGHTVTVDDSWRGNPEAGVAGVMRRQGRTVFYAENKLWHCLFGLLFWEELFESGQLHSSFDWVPHCLKDKSFARLFARDIDAKLSAVSSQSVLALILRTIAGKWGTPNGLFAWDYIDMDAIRPLLAAHPGGVSTILRLMSEDFRAMRDGFPDLMIEFNGEVAFLEVKAEGDAVRRNQLTRLRQLSSAGIKAEIVRVDFRFDPDQEYVVVDIETTGSRSNGDRVTEIGAVKIRNHEIVDEWTSLINPQRSIPAAITRLTGITNAMVRDAPLFAEIADSFMQFMGDGIFVADNVNFDYGFLSGEYERLERRFRFPKLCTCATMRKQFPGHKSYSLANLCDVYDIDLKGHHRALCDARAAAHLLNLINGKRDTGPATLAEQAA